MEAIPWGIFFVDLISPYKIRIEGHDEPLILKALIIIDPATGWFEIILYNIKQAYIIANLVEKMWLFK